MAIESFIRGKDASLESTIATMRAKLPARVSAYGEFFERLDTHYFRTHFYLGETRANRPFVHHPQERWFAPGADGSRPAALQNPELHAFYNPDGEIDAEMRWT